MHVPKVLETNFINIQVHLNNWREPLLNNQGAVSTGFLGVFTRAVQNVNTLLRTLFLQISQVIEIHCINL